MTTFLLSYLIVSLCFANGAALYAAMFKGVVEDRFVLRAAVLWPLLTGTALVVVILSIIGFAAAGAELAYRSIKARLKRA